MIGVRLHAQLAPSERFALDTLLDASALVPVAGTTTPTVEIVLHADAPASADAWLRQPDAALHSAPGTVTLSTHTLRDVARVLAMAAEHEAPGRDKHQRPLSAENRLVRADLAQHPVVSLLARALRVSAERAAAGRPLVVARPWPAQATWAAALSHDIDVVSWWPAFTGLRVVELAKKGEWARVGRVLGSAAAALATNPVQRALRQVLAIEAAEHARATWFVLCGTPTVGSFAAGDLTYAPERALVRSMLGEIAGAQHAIGLHGSLETVTDGRRFTAQRQRLATLAGGPVRGVRQHFLRRDPAHTEADMATAGFGYDSTTGFPDRNGFRNGLADVSPYWDASQKVPLALESAPFCWMDRAQSKYQGVEDPSAWIAEAERLAATCASVQGLWCGIWHPNLDTALGFPDALEAYAALVASLRRNGAWLATLDDIVAWRRARRAIRVVGSDASGLPIAELPRALAGEAPAVPEVLLADGRALSAVRTA